MKFLRDSKRVTLKIAPMRLLLLLAAVLPLFAQVYNAPGYGPALTLAPLPASNTSLGKKLFFDKRLSADGTIACASCHVPHHAFTDPQTLSAGVFGRHGTGHTPSLLGRGSGTLQFWDGRAATLEKQVLEPIKNPVEMGSPLDEVVVRLRSDPAYAGLTAPSMAAALASYVRSIRSVDTPFDHFLAGTPGGFTDLEREGLRLFRDKARCYICHSGDNLTDEMFHNTGVAWRDGRIQDAGRGGVTGKAAEMGAFKTPTLREIAKTAPYMHDGSIQSLEEVIEYYDRGGNPNPGLDENIVPLHLSKADKEAILAFLRALSGTVRDGN